MSFLRDVWERVFRQLRWRDAVEHRGTRAWAPAEGDSVQGGTPAWLPPAVALALPLEPREEEAVVELNELLAATTDEHLTALPAFPSLASRTLALAWQQDVDVAQLVREISRDPALAAAILRMANTAHVARGGPVRGLRDAVMLLGLKTCVTIIAGLSARALFNAEVRDLHRQHAQVWSHLWEHALTTALAAGQVAMTRREGALDIAFLGGLLHDIGKALGLRALHHLMLRGKLGQVPTTPVVYRVLEDCHESLGQRAVALWQLPPSVAEVCATHHEPVTLEEPAATALHVLRLVSSLHELTHNPYRRADTEQEIFTSARALGLNEHGVRAAHAETRAAEEKTRLLLAANTTR
ncbi:MAG: HDOD domain-containing protein [Myxococcota bacterium]